MAIDPFVPEAWTWLAVTLTIVIARYVSRLLQVRSIRRLGWEDLIMLFVTLLYIVEINFLVKLEFTPTNLIPPGTHFDPDDLADVALRVYGSKLTVAQEQVNCALIWGTKACLLLYYAKLTYALPGSFRWTKLVAAYVATGYVVMEILYTAVWCRPFYDYWSVPVANPQCATAENHLILNFILNVSSDFMILAIPLPLLLRTKLPPRKKLALVAVFSLGLFVIVSATLSKYYSFNNLNGTGWVYWFAREMSMAVIVANIPHLWALTRRIFRLHAFVGSALASTALSSAPSRFYQDIEDPLSPRGPHHKHVDDRSSHSLDNYDIDRVLAGAEREGLPTTQPMRFRDMTERTSEHPVVAGGILAMPASPLPAYMLKAPSPTSPFGVNFDRWRDVLTGATTDHTSHPSPRTAPRLA